MKTKIEAITNKRSEKEKCGKMHDDETKAKRDIK